MLSKVKGAGSSAQVIVAGTGAVTSVPLVGIRIGCETAQKRQFSEQVTTFVGGVGPSAYTDITGGLLQAIEFLNEKETGRKIIFIFSDLEEDLVEGYVRDIPLELDGFEVVALNVTKLRSDNVDPRDYLGRLDQWQGRVEAGGGTWRVINDLDRLEMLLDT